MDEKLVTVIAVALLVAVVLAAGLTGVRERNKQLDAARSSSVPVSLVVPRGF